MAENTVEYRLELDAYTPETLPQRVLAECLKALADLYGQDEAVHFIAVEPGSARVVSSVPADSQPEVDARIEIATQQEEAPADVRRALNQLAEVVAKSGKPARILNPQRATVYEFPSGEVRPEPEAYGPFWQPSRLRGTIILIGGKGDPVSVWIKVEDKTHSCRARRDVAQSLFPYMWGEPVQVSGAGKWIRQADGEWRLLQFNIESFAPLDNEPLLTTVARLRSIEGEWKKRPDPHKELHDIRYGGEEKPKPLSSFRLLLLRNSL